MNSVSDKTTKGISPNFGHRLGDVYGFVDVLIRFWVQQVKVKVTVFKLVIWTDHRLVVSKHLLKIQTPIRKQKPMNQLNVRASSDPAKQEELQRNITAALKSYPIDSFSTTADSQSLTDEWSSLNSSIMKAATDTLGLSTRKHQDWFDDNHPEIHGLLQAKNEAHNAFLRNPNPTIPLEGIS